MCRDGCSLVVSVRDAVAYDGATLRWSQAGDTGQWRHCSVVPWQSQWQQHDIITPDPGMKADCCTSSQWHQHQTRGGGLNRWTQYLYVSSLSSSYKSYEPSQWPPCCSRVSSWRLWYLSPAQVNNISTKSRLGNTHQGRNLVQIITNDEHRYYNNCQLLLDWCLSCYLHLETKLCKVQRVQIK